MGTKATLVWIPIHVGITGNDKTDSLAVNESKNPSESRICNQLSPSEDFSVFKRIWSSHLTKNLHSSCGKTTVTFRKRHGIIPWQFAKKRRHSVALHRIRTGHNLLNKYRHRIDNGADPSCRLGCAEIEDSAHLILDCPHLEQFRSNLRLVCAKLKVHFDLENVTGLNPSHDKLTQLKIRDHFIDFLKASKMRYMV